MWSYTMQEDQMAGGAFPPPPRHETRAGRHARLLAACDEADRAVILWLARRVAACGMGDEAAALDAHLGLTVALKAAEGAASDLLLLGD